MLNPSDKDLKRAVISARQAQLLRGGVTFGTVAFREGVVLLPEQVQFDAGYADCLPVLGGGCWRDPDATQETETAR